MSFRRILVVLATLFLICSAANAGSLVASGYQSVDTPIVLPQGGYFGGFDILPNGNFIIHDGFSIREINSAGNDVRTLYTYEYGQSVYGSFVRYNPVTNKVYFGESSFGTIRSYDLNTGVASNITTLSYNYDLDYWNNGIYAVGLSSVYKIDESTGALDLIVSAGFVSGPLAFDGQGNLYYGTGDLDWSTLNDQNIYRWSADEVASAVGAGTLTADSAHIFAANVNGPGGFAIGGSGELIYTDSVSWPAQIRMIVNGTNSTLAVASVPGQYPWLQAVRYNSANGCISAAVSWYDNGFQNVISTLVPVPEPSSAFALISFIGLANFRRLLRPGK